MDNNLYICNISEKCTTHKLKSGNTQRCKHSKPHKLIIADSINTCTDEHGCMYEKIFIKSLKIVKCILVQNKWDK